LLAIFTIIYYNKNGNNVKMPKMSGSSVKVTYSLPQDLINEVRLVVREGAAPSYSAFVEDALRKAVRREREKLIAE
jgi:metal-responsive CopG/Arc/MetJ family transcriptional regulator